jgi:hypothetical protein
LDQIAGILDDDGKQAPGGIAVREPEHGTNLGRIGRWAGRGRTNLNRNFVAKGRVSA